jgi:alkanesulfonate monooxygenase SsuD/methylene tetrahydromethanopterin reductase-like flavin-dependent oxidoreductase (luciferase family)
VKPTHSVSILTEMPAAGSHGPSHRNAIGVLSLASTHSGFNVDELVRTVYCLAAFPQTILSSEKIGFALRPGVFSPQEIKETAVVLEASDRVSRIFIPDHRIWYESLEIASSILALTKHVRAGSGVIRLLEHDALLLTRRVHTLQALFSNRFILGVGTGSPGPQPGKSVTAMLERLDELKKGFQGFPEGVKPPEIYVAALKLGIARRAASKVDGLLLNFCSPQHAASLIDAFKAERDTHVDFACYLKIFYSSQSDGTAQRLMLQEFLNYDSAPQYHEMFVQDGVAKTISSLKENEGWKTDQVDVPRELLRVSLANPREEELVEYVKSFRQAGVTLPVVYPYFPNGEDARFKLETMKGIMKIL